MKKLVYCITLFAAGCCASHFYHSFRPTPVLVRDFDTILLTDTCFIHIPPALSDSLRVRAVERRLPLACPDSVRLAAFDFMPDSVPADSADVVVPIVRKVYADSSFRAVLSGYEPSLDSLIIYPRPAVIMARGKSRSAWSLGVTAGACVTPRGISPGLTVGLTYTFLSF